MKTLPYKLFPILICFVFLFPILKENISTLSIILLTLNLIVYKISSNDFVFFKRKTILLTIPFLIITFFSLFSTNFKISFAHINHSLLFLLIPIVFSLIPKKIFSLEKLNLYFTTLKILCLLIAIVYIISFFVNNPLWKFNIEFHSESSFRNYIYNDFKWFKIHPTYYTTILIFCVTQSLLLVLEKKKYFELIYVVCFLTITLLLLTKLTIVLMVALVLFIILFKNKSSLIYKGGVLTAYIMALFFLIQFTPGIKNRFLEVYNSVNVKPKELAFDSTNIRMAIFDCSLKLVKENWVFGVGFENLQKNLNSCYKSNYNSDFYKNHDYLTHNYYLYIFISTGLLGFLCFLLYLANIVWISFKSNLFLFRSFLLTILILCFIEDFFYRQYGVLFFNLILMCFINHIEYQKQILTETDRD
jgi:O-antigen ligase